MKKSLIERVMRECIVDTRNYRYKLDYTPRGWSIKRLPINLLDTTAALHDWQTVYTDDDSAQA